MRGADPFIDTTENDFETAPQTVTVKKLLTCDVGSFLTVIIYSLPGCDSNPESGLRQPAKQDNGHNRG